MNPIYKKCLVRMILYFGYGLLGSWLFSLIEKREESYAVTADRLLENLRKDMKNKYNITNSTDFDKFVKTASNAIQLMKKLDWTFANGCGFTFAAITTVGYGDISPGTTLGQVLTIPFCLIGLPIAMLAFKTAGEVAVLGLKTITVTFEKKILGRQNPERKLIKCLLIIIFWISVLICSLATAEMYVDGWTFVEGVYCWFITFTTIGFGDYVPFEQFRVDKKDSDWILIVAGMIFVVPFVIGLCLVSSLLNLLVDCSEHIKIHFHKVSSCTMCSRCNQRSETGLQETGKTVNNDLKLQSISFRRCSV